MEGGLGWKEDGGREEDRKRDDAREVLLRRGQSGVLSLSVSVSEREEKSVRCSIGRCVFLLCLCRCAAPACCQSTLRRVVFACVFGRLISLFLTFALLQPKKSRHSLLLLIGHPLDPDCPTLNTYIQHTFIPSHPCSGLTFLFTKMSSNPLLHLNAAVPPCVQLLQPKSRLSLMQCQRSQSQIRMQQIRMVIRDFSYPSNFTLCGQYIACILSCINEIVVREE